MKLEAELDELSSVTKVEGNRRRVIRREFAEMEFPEKNKFIDEIYWGIIKTINPKNYVGNKLK
jgi:hypothetical protein